MDTTTHGAKKPVTGDASTALRSAIRDNADLVESVLDGSLPLDKLIAEGAGGTEVRLKDTSAGSGLKTFSLLTSAGKTYLRKLNDAGSSATVLVEIDHATGAVTIPDGKLLANPEAWITATLSGTWAAISGQAPRFYRHLGRVYLQGGATGGTASAFQLPAGYRPSRQETHVVWDVLGSVARGVTVAATGNVSPVGGSPAFFDGISFRVDA